MSSLNELETTPEGLHYLSQIPTEGDVTFLPALKIVRPVGICVESVAQITDFLVWLKSAGRSIQHLIVGDQDSLESSFVDFSPLEQFSGLRMLWTTTDTQSPSQTSEYLCGSGTPEQLDFSAVDVNSATS